MIVGKEAASERIFDKVHNALKGLYKVLGIGIRCQEDYFEGERLF